jgi:hypothetical protein
MALDRERVRALTQVSTNTDPACFEFDNRTANKQLNLPNQRCPLITVAGRSVTPARSTETGPFLGRFLNG